MEDVLQDPPLGPRSGFYFFVSDSQKHFPRKFKLGKMLRVGRHPVFPIGIRFPVGMVYPFYKSWVGQKILCRHAVFCFYRQMQTMGKMTPSFLGKVLEEDGRPKRCQMTDVG